MSDPCEEPIRFGVGDIHCGNDAAFADESEQVWRCPWCHRREQERLILLDLIAELRTLNSREEPGCGGAHGMWADDVHDCADRAEARLREVQGE